MSDVSSIEKSTRKENEFNINTACKKIKLIADSESAMDDWVRKIKAAVFRSQLEDNQVKIAIPVTCIHETELSSSISNMDIIKIAANDDELKSSEQVKYICPI